MAQRITVVEPYELFEFPNDEEDKSVEEERSENFYEAFDGINLGLFWIVVMFLSYILAFSVALLVIMDDKRKKFLAHHYDDNLASPLPPLE